MPLLKIYNEPNRAAALQLTQRPQMDEGDLTNTIFNVYQGVITEGDAYLISATKQFDNCDIASIKVPEEEVRQAYLSLDETLKAAILGAKANITQFHTAQLTPSITIETMPGVVCTQKPVAIQRVGIYIPGGTAPLFSTILMLAVPAMIAGCKEIVLCSPPTHHGHIHPVILATAHLCGITDIMQVGGAQAIAAMAIGTTSIKKVSKIFGPGNQYVTSAKQYAQRYGVAIDMPAGPSEVLVYADETCVPEFVAADLLSQAEHGKDSQVVAVVSSIVIAEAIEAEVTLQLEALPRKDIATAALANSFTIVQPDVEQAFEYINTYAPEHFIIASEHALILSERVLNAGSVFLGNYCPEAVGDYASGTNHTLPTYGWAASYSGVNIDSFMRKITFQHVTQQGIAALAPLVVPMAVAEQLEAHANAVRVRINPNK